MMRWTCAVLLAAACSSADKQVSVLSFEPPNACSTVGRLTVVNSRTAPASIDSVVRLSGVAVSAPPFLDDPSPIFTLALPEQLPPEQTAIPVRYTPSGNDPRHVSTASLKVVISGVPVQLNLSNAPIGEELAGVPAFVDLGAIPPDGVFAPCRFLREGAPVSSSQRSLRLVSRFGSSAFQRCSCNRWTRATSKDSSRPALPV